MTCRAAPETCDGDEAGWQFVPGQPLVPGLLAWTPLGDGPRCETWLAWDLGRWSPAAVKVPLPATVRAGRGAAALGPELDAVAGLEHPGIQRLFDADLEAELPYLQFEYIEGPTLEAALDDGPFDPVDVVLTGMQLAAALGYMHRNGLVHLDLKPGNAVLRDGRPVLIDFGFTSPIGTPPPPGRARGTPAWMAPEQIRRKPAAPSMDLFALGALLFELVTGEAAFEPCDQGPERRRWPQLSGGDRTAHTRALELTAPRRLGRLIADLMEPDPADRPASATDVLAALDEAMPASAAGERWWPSWATPALFER